MVVWCCRIPTVPLLESWQVSFHGDSLLQAASDPRDPLRPGGAHNAHPPDAHDVYARHAQHINRGDWLIAFLCPPVSCLLSLPLSCYNWWLCFPDPISAPPHPTPNMVGFFLPLYFPPKEGLCLCIFLPCHVYIPSIHSPQGANPWGYCTPTKIYRRQPKEVQSSLDQERIFRL